MTQAAVSQRIRNLELRLGTQLFSRQPRGVALSTQGEAWLPHVQAALGLLLHSAANLFESPRRKMTIAASASVIELWIIPRLAAINARLPHVQLAFATVQNQPDYQRSEADLEIRFGDGNWPGYQAHRLFVEEIAPVCAPALLENADGDWQALPRIALSGPRIGWRDWATSFDIVPSSAPLLRFDTFALALRAAEAGAGVLLASLMLCQTALTTGALMRLTDQSVQMQDGYWVSWRRNAAEFAERSILVDCLSQDTP